MSNAEAHYQVLLEENKRLTTEGEIMREYLEDIAKGHDGHQTYSGTMCSEIAQNALDQKSNDRRCPRRTSASPRQAGAR